MCGIVGVINAPDAAKVAYLGLFSLQHRGQEASGISACERHHINTIKGKGLVTDVFDAAALVRLGGNMAIGHNRYATSGSKAVCDAQPVTATYALGEISIVHNGNLINSDEIHDSLVRDGAIFQSQMDTETILHLIARSQQSHLRDRIIEALRVIKGAYSLIIMSRSKMFVVRDPHAVRPLSIGRLKNGGYIVASETCAFDLVEAEFIRDVRAGEMLTFEEGKDDFISEQLFDETDPRICAFEYVYLARPDSVIEGKSVYEVRQNLGRKLAQISPVADADLVVPVPDSGISSAIGFAKECGVPFELAIVRNHYVGRTFIEPTQDIRNLKVKLKLNPIASALKGKKIVVIDDSIVRGTTSRKIVELLRHAGASEIHMRIACPEIRFPDRYGIDTPSYKELISVSRDKDAVCEYIGADSLEFLPIDDFVASLGDERRYSLVSFDGDYFIK